jgi:hypothetical protein
MRLMLMTSILKLLTVFSFMLASVSANAISPHELMSQSEEAGKIFLNWTQELEKKRYLHDETPFCDLSVREPLEQVLIVFEGAGRYSFPSALVDVPEQIKLGNKTISVSLSGMLKTWGTQWSRSSWNPELVSRTEKLRRFIEENPGTLYYRLIDSVLGVSSGQVLKSEFDDVLDRESSENGRRPFLPSDAPKASPSRVLYYSMSSRDAAEACVLRLHKKAERIGKSLTIRIVGHSMGAHSGIQLAKSLETKNIPVARILTIDPVPKNLDDLFWSVTRWWSDRPTFYVSKNVESAVNFYQTEDTHSMNIGVRGQRLIGLNAQNRKMPCNFFSRPDYCHMNLLKNPLILKWIQTLIIESK